MLPRHVVRIFGCADVRSSLFALTTSPDSSHVLSTNIDCPGILVDVLYGTTLAVIHSLPYVWILK
jgi:hypothetical protein